MKISMIQIFFSGFQVKKKTDHLSLAMLEISINFDIKLIYNKRTLSKLPWPAIHAMKFLRNVHK